MTMEPPPGSQPPEAGPTPPSPPPTAPEAAPTQSWTAQPAAPPASAPPPAVAWESPETAAGPAPGIEFAPHGARLVAYILDGIIIGIVVGIFVAIGSVLLVSGATYEGNRIVSVTPTAALLGTVFFVIGGVIGILYFPFFWATGGSTLGMRPFNLRVVRDRDGGRIGWGTAILRLIGLWVAAAVFYIGFIWIFIDKRRRGWQDLIAGTVVIRQG
jgi:uncharacterized RDD family membrane protein YckC